MTNYNGPVGFSARCSNCGHFKINHSFMGSRCPGTFEQGPVGQEEVRMAAQKVNYPIHVTVDAELVRQLDAVEAAQELVAYLHAEFDETCWDCLAPEGHPHGPECGYVGLKERILAAPRL